VSDFQVFSDQTYIVATLSAAGDLILCNQVQCALAVPASTLAAANLPQNVRFSLNGQYMGIRFTPSLGAPTVGEEYQALFSLYQIDRVNLTATLVASTASALGDPTGCNFNWDVSNDGHLAVSVGNYISPSSIVFLSQERTQAITSNLLGSLQYVYNLAFNKNGTLAMDEGFFILGFRRLSENVDGSYSWYDSSWISLPVGTMGYGPNILLGDDNSATLSQTFVNSTTSQDDYVIASIGAAANSSLNVISSFSVGPYGGGLLHGTSLQYLRWSPNLALINNNYVIPISNNTSGGQVLIPVAAPSTATFQAYSASISSFTTCVFSNGCTWKNGYMMWNGGPLSPTLGSN
jgi:hypothetical protein